MRPLRLNADSSAISRTLPQRGHLGRRKSYVTGSGMLQASWTVIVEPPRRSHTHPNLSPIGCHDAESMWRRHDAIMKLSWPRGAIFGRNDNGAGRICIKGATRICIKLRPAHGLSDGASRRNMRPSGARACHSAACASTCWRKRGMTSSAMSCIDCFSHASLGPSQSTPVIRRLPNGPTSSRKATSLSSMVLGEP